MSPLGLIVTIAAVAGAFAWIASLLTRDTSWIDRLWSILPETYVWVVATSDHLRDARLDVLAVLTTLWGLRLTFNFARKGGYRGVEDYRWAELRTTMSPALFQVVNLVFIVTTQSALLVAIALPALVARDHPHPWRPLDTVLAALFLAALVGETVADEQQWRFHQRKHRGETERPFLTEGLFRYARHPNYFFELAQWWLVYVMGAAGAGVAGWWALVGPVALTALFVGSTRFTESISASKYPDYATYRRTTSPIVPWRPRRQSS